MKGPLDGIRVIEWGQLNQAPFAALMLGDLGAEIIKLENTEGGDSARGLMKLFGVTSGIHGRNFYYEANNRNKKSLALNLKTDEGRQIVYALVSKSDVFIHNFRMGVPARLKLDYQTLSVHNPRLIYVNCTGYGAHGPNAGDPVNDSLGLGRSGIMTLVGEPGMDPVFFPNAMADQMGAVMSAYAVLAGIVARERSGVGQEITASLLGGMACCLLNLPLNSLLTVGQQMGRRFRAEAGSPLFNWYRCSDNRWIYMSLLQADRHWHDFCEAVGIQELEHDPRFSEMVVRGQNAKTLIAILDSIFAQKPREEWMKIMGKYKDFVFGPINDVEDLLTDPQMLENDYIKDFDHPQFGKTRIVGHPIEMTKTPLSVQRAAPEYGEHTEEILTELLGYTWEDIGRLRDNKVI